MVAALPNMKNKLADSSPLVGRETDVPPCVLVVEDHDDTRFMLRYLMEQHGCLVIEAADGVEAVSLAESVCPSLILMDTGLPRLDGLAATRRIRKITMLDNVPIIFISGHAQPNLRAEAIATGGNDYLVKPLKLSELEMAVERHLGKSRGIRSV
jgi:DNA-binding response OmpR family regulator